jgi:DNA polymerase-3 subunit delta
MQLKPEQLGRHLAAGPTAPVYVVTGDEPLQVKEAGDAIREAARAHGFSERQVFDVQKGFDWGQLAAATDALSLFAEKRLMDLRMPGGKPGTDGSRALVEYLDRPAPDTVLLITLPKLDAGQRTSKWVKALDKAGVVVTLWPVAAQSLPGWLQRRARTVGLELDADTAAFLAGQTEGNLLAAAQELEKLALVHGRGRISFDQAAASVAASARYNVFELVDSALQGAVAHSLRMLQGLRGEGTPEPVVLWALARELRLLEAVALAAESGGDPGKALAEHRVWQSRKALVAQGARRHRAAGWRRLVGLCALVDRAIKGQAVADTWQLLEDIVASMASGRLPVAR